MLQAQLGDQALDPVLARDLLMLVDANTRDYFYACDEAGDCNWGGEKSAHPDAGAPWWQSIGLAHGRTVQRVGRNDLRPRDFYQSGAALNFQHMVDLVGGPLIEKDPQGLSPTKVSYRGYNQPDPILAAWVRSGPALTGSRFRLTTALGWTAAAIALGIGAAYLTR